MRVTSRPSEPTSDVAGSGIFLQDTAPTTGTSVRPKTTQGPTFADELFVFILHWVAFAVLLVLGLYSHYHFIYGKSRKTV